MSQMSVQGDILFWVIGVVGEKIEIRDFNPRYAKLPTLVNDGQISPSNMGSDKTRWNPALAGRFEKTVSMPEDLNQLCTDSTHSWLSVEVVSFNDVSVRIVTGILSDVTLARKPTQAVAERVNQLKKMKISVTEAFPDQGLPTHVVGYFCPDSHVEPDVASTLEMDELLVQWANSSSTSDPELGTTDLKTPNVKLRYLMARDMTLVAPRGKPDSWNTYQVRTMIVDPIALGMAQNYQIEKFVESIGNIHHPTKTKGGTSRRLAHEIREDFYVFRSRLWWPRPSTNQMINSTWENYAERNALVSSVNQIGQELADYSSVELERNQSQLNRGALVFALLALAMTGLFETINGNLSKPYLVVDFLFLISLGILYMRYVLRYRRQ